MFPHTITIYRHKVENGADIITRQIVKGVYWYGGAGITPSGKGTVEDNPTTIITSPETTAQYKSDWDIEPKDRILKGEHPEINSLKEISAALMVLKVDDNICGSTVDNITITAK